MFDKNSLGLQRRLAKKDYIFDENNANFVNNDYNRVMFAYVQNHFNDLRRSRGYVFLNEVLVYLGLRPTAIGQIAGWTMMPIEIKIVQTKVRDGKEVEYFLEIENQGLIVFDVMGD